MEYDYFTFDELLDANGFTRRGCWIYAPGNKVVCRSPKGAANSVDDDALDFFKAILEDEMGCIVIDGETTRYLDYIDIMDRDSHCVLPDDMLDICKDLNLTVDGRMSNYSDTVLDYFWSDGVENLATYIRGLFPNSGLTVVSRKGKDWYVVPSVETLDTLGMYYYDFYIITPEAIAEAEKVVDILNGTKEDLDMECWVDTFWYGSSDYVASLPEPLKRRLESMNMECWDLLNLMLEHKGDDDRAINDYSDLVDTALSEIVDVPKTVCGFPYIKDENGEFAVDFGDKYGLYHVRLFELYKPGSKDMIMRAYEKRKRERIEQAAIFEKAANVFVGFEDSIDSGNCRSGSLNFCKKHNLNPEYEYRG